MEELRLRFTQMNVVRENAMRTLEHNTLIRLMHRNRNPHRRAPYFQRLEHVRRLLRRINAHVAWKAPGAQQSGHSSQKSLKRQRRQSPEGGVCAADIDALMELVSLEECLVTCAIPQAASRFTEELIAREHYLPFAVTVVAMLARVYVLERPLLRALRGALAEARVLVLPLPSVRKATAEDVGEVIASPPDVSPHSQVLKRMRPTRKRYFSSTSQETPGTQEVAKTVDKIPSPMSTIAVQLDPTGSLFDLMAEENSQLADLAKASVVSGNRFVASQSTDLKAVSKISVDEEQTITTPSVHDCQEQMTACVPDSQIMKKNDSGKKEGQCSESEDLDDIFAELSD